MTNMRPPEPSAMHCFSRYVFEIGGSDRNLPSTRRSASVLAFTNYGARLVYRFRVKDPASSTKEVERGGRGPGLSACGVSVAVPLKTVIFSRRQGARARGIGRTVILWRNARQYVATRLTSHSVLCHPNVMGFTTRKCTAPAHGLL